METYSGDLYFMVAEDGKYTHISPMMYRVRHDNHELDLQLIRDLGWMFSLPVSQRPHYHSLYRYRTSTPRTSVAHHKILTNHLMETGQIPNALEFLCRFRIDSSEPSLAEIYRRNQEIQCHVNGGQHNYTSWVSLYSGAASFNATETSHEVKEATISYTIDLCYNGMRAHSVMCLPMINVIFRGSEFQESKSSLSESSDTSSSDV